MPFNPFRDEADQAHAAFYAEAKIIGFDPKLKEESKRLTNISRQLANVRSDDQMSPEQNKSVLNAVFKEFNRTVDDILEVAVR